MASSARNAICIICTDRCRSLDFYRNALGAETIPGDVEGTCPWLRIGDLNITFVSNTDKGSKLDHSETAMAIMLLQVDDLVAAYDQAMRHGARVVDALEPNGVHFIIADPDGIIIEVMQSEQETE